MTFRHLANMISGYRRPERPGEAFAYNDCAIQLYQKTLFDRVFKEDPERVIHASHRLGVLGFEDGIDFTQGKRRIKASVRDFSRIAWFWLNRGQWDGKQLLDRRFFDRYMRPHVAADLPHTKGGEGEDYLGIKSYGGGSDHFTKFGPGIYGFNWWLNSTGRTHRRNITWPDAPEDTLAVECDPNLLRIVLVNFLGNAAKPDRLGSMRHLNLTVGAKSAFVIDERDRARLRKVEVGLLNDRHAEVTKGLDKEAIVILAPETNLIDGTKVRAILRE